MAPAASGVLDSAMVSVNTLKQLFGSPRGYSHFDEPKNSATKAAEILSKEDYVSRHGFYPFIHFVVKQRKIIKSETDKTSKVKEINIKVRQLAYCSHVDRYIYSFYARKINARYNKWSSVNNLDNNIVAYRYSDRSNIFSKKNNITFAKNVFEFIHDHLPCKVLVSDFEKYFDTIDHLYLKTQLCKLLEIPRLPNDWYAIYKNITKYSFVDKDDIENYRKIRFGLLKEERGCPLLNREQFAEFRQGNFIQKNKKTYGIPQGSPISAVFSNIYLMEFDLAMKAYVSQWGGLYVRYCDDVIIILPERGEDEFPSFNQMTEFFKTWSSGARIPHLKYSQKKTKYYRFDTGGCAEECLVEEKTCGTAKRSNKLDYLGFIYDGNVVQLRPKSVLKYYYKLYKKIGNSILTTGKSHNIYAIYSNKIYRNKNIILEENEASEQRYIRLNKYLSYKFSRRKLHNFKIVKNKSGVQRIELQGNYISYVRRIHNIFKHSNLKFVEKIQSRHIRKISNRLKHWVSETFVVIRSA